MLLINIQHFASVHVWILMRFINAKVRTSERQTGKGGDREVGTGGWEEKVEAGMRLIKVLCCLLAVDLVWRMRSSWFAHPSAHLVAFVSLSVLCPKPYENVISTSYLLSWVAKINLKFFGNTDGVWSSKEKTDIKYFVSLLTLKILFIKSGRTPNKSLGVKSTSKGLMWVMKRQPNLTSKVWSCHISSHHKMY